ncbi:unnamed protein product [Caenorhabditis nigoni]
MNFQFRRVPNETIQKKTDRPGSSFDEINIVSILEKAVNPNSRKTMVHLGFSGEYEDFINGWEEKVSKFLPSLQSIKINFMEYGGEYQFSTLCYSFPNLCVLDISYAEDLKTLEGVKNLKYLQKLVMRSVTIEDVDGYKELSELKNLRFLDVSGEQGKIISSLLEADVRMENLEFLDCSMTMVEVHELKKFVEHHPKLKTVVAISSGCDHLYIPTIDLLNCNSPDSIVKSLKYALSNNNDDLAKECLMFITDRLDKIHQQFNESEIRGLLSALCCVLRESKNKMAKYWAIQCFAESSFFETERFFTTFSLEIPGIVELVFKPWEHLRWSEFKNSTISLILSVFERMVNFLRFGRILQDRLLSFIMEKAMELSCQYPENIRKVTLILIKTYRFMSSEQYTEMCNNKKVIKGLHDFAHKLITLDLSSNQQIMEIIVSHLKHASENAWKHLVSDRQAIDKCYEQVMIIPHSLSKDSQKNLSEIVLKLTTVINLNDQDDKTLAFMACSILSLLLAKNLIENREYANNLLEELNDSWGRSKISNCLLTWEKFKEMILTIFTSEHSTDESIRFGLRLMSIFIKAERYRSEKYWNFMGIMSEGIRNNEKWTKNTRESASSVLNEMSTIEKK